MRETGGPRKTRTTRKALNEEVDTTRSTFRVFGVFGGLKKDRPALAGGLIRGEDDAKTVESALPMGREVQVFANGAQKKQLLAAAEFVVIRLIGERD